MVEEVAGPPSRLKRKNDPDPHERKTARLDDDVEALVQQLKLLNTPSQLDRQVGGFDLARLRRLMDLAVPESQLLRACTSDAYLEVIHWFIQSGRVSCHTAFHHAVAHNMAETVESLFDAASLSHDDKMRALRQTLQQDSCKTVQVLMKKMGLHPRGEILQWATKLDAFWTVKMLLKMDVTGENFIVVRK